MEQLFNLDFQLRQEKLEMGETKEEVFNLENKIKMHDLFSRPSHAAKQLHVEAKHVEEEVTYLKDECEEFVNQMSCRTGSGSLKDPCIYIKDNIDPTQASTW